MNVSVVNLCPHPPDDLEILLAGGRFIQTLFLGPVFGVCLNLHKVFQTLLVCCLVLGSMFVFLARDEDREAPEVAVELTSGVCCLRSSVPALASLLSSTQAANGRGPLPNLWLAWVQLTHPL